MRARVSMRWTVTLFAAFFLTVSLGLVLFATLREAEERWDQGALLHARTAAHLLARASRHALQRGDRAALGLLTRQIAGSDIVERVVVVDRAGGVLSDNAPGEVRPPLLRQTPALGDVPLTEADGHDVEVLAPIRHEGAPIGAVFLRCSVREYDAMLPAMRNRGILIGVLAILVASALAYGLAGVISAPLRRLAHSMEAIAHGQLHQELPEEGGQELRQIAGTFNRMARALRHRMRELESLRELGLSVSRSLDLSEVVAAAVASVETALPDTRVRIWLQDAEGVCLVEAVPPGRADGEARSLPLSGSTPVARAARERQPILAGGPDEYMPLDAGLAAQFGAQSLAAVPLCAEPHVVGVLVALRGGSGVPFAKEDIPFLSAAAHGIALSLGNARLFAREAHMASILQRLLLPSAPAAVAGLEVAACWRPAPGAGVGGDYYDFIALPDGRWGIVIGDVCGKGTIAASYTTMAKYVLRSYAYETESPAEILRRTNAALYAQMADAQADSQAPIFVTMLCALYDPLTSQLAYSHAGHPLGTLARADSSVAVRLDRGGPPVGVVRQATYREEVLYLAPGDTLALYTDGIVEAARSDYLVEHEAIAALLARFKNQPVQSAAEAFLSEVLPTGDTTARDDITLLILRCRGMSRLPLPEVPDGALAREPDTAC